MDDNKPLIVGIDPGTTTAYAVLDLNGEIISVKSAKNFGLNRLLADVHALGKVIAIGTDKAKVPSLVESFSAKTGAKIIYPNGDLKVDEKKSMIVDYKTENEHQNDALASSLFAYKKIKSIIDRIERFAKENIKEHIKGPIADLVLTKGLSIREAADIIENPHKEETRVMKRVVEEKALSQNDFMKLYRIVKRYEKDFYLLKRQNEGLKKQVAGMQKKYRDLDPKTIALNAMRKFRKNILFKERSINFLEAEITSKDYEINNLQRVISKFNDVISRINNVSVLKKLNNLGSSEFNRKMKLLNISKNDILLVKNPNILSGDVARFLDGKVSSIITSIPVSRKIRQIYGYSFINSGNIRILDETELFAFSPKKDIEDALKSNSVLTEVIENYRKSRSYFKSL